jgi:hypothetical protein
MDGVTRIIGTSSPSTNTFFIWRMTVAPISIGYTPNKDFYQGGFPGAVFSQQHVRLTSQDLEVDIFQRPHAGEGFAYSAQSQKDIRTDHTRIVLYFREKTDAVW